MFNIIGKRYWFFLLSAIVIVPGFVSLVTWHLRLGPDFAGGTEIEVRTVTNNTVGLGSLFTRATKISSLPAGKVLSTSPTLIKVQVPEKHASRLLSTQVESALGVPAIVKTTSSSHCPTQCIYTLTFKTALTSAQSSQFLQQFRKNYPKTPAVGGISPEYVQPVAGTACPTDCRYYIRSKLLSSGQEAAFTSAVSAAPFHGHVITYLSVGGSVAKSTTQNAVEAVIAAAIAILLYITFAFRKMPHPFRYGTAAVIAMLHDVLVVVGIFSILGHVLNVEIDATFVTAMLTIIGFSVHDTIVIFDRIRENVTRRTGEAFEAIVNHSVLQSFVRSINTSFTVVLTLGAIFLFSGESIRYFVLAMLIGIISGTYSSIFNASPILVVWQTGELKRLFGGRQRIEDTAAATRPVAASGRSL